MMLIANIKLCDYSHSVIVGLETYPLRNVFVQLHGYEWQLCSLALLFGVMCWYDNDCVNCTRRIGSVALATTLWGMCTTGVSILGLGSSSFVWRADCIIQL